ncbi:ABC transporter substrate-binding protein [Natronomonas salina]|uniref:ABC transporter substrate-binding protein n=1 Tax=Natronomonas salina TaxID=1710540 RepID=UPI0015B57A4A|nr:ABC transporter substrate-binding protein [Natronomonas salina]QLD88596.1 ABC transporter substrate-binding protein [Natronomonas salina]
MTKPREHTGDGVSRRSFLAAGLIGAAGATSGCIDMVRSAADPDGDSQVSLSIATVPADSDRASVRIVEHLESNLRAAGVDVSRDVRSPQEFLGRVLVDHEYDVYVGTHPLETDPEYLYEALHSTFTHEPGWQNPFGYTNIPFDAYLEDQRLAAGDERAAIVDRILSTVVQEKPFEPICVPDEYRVADPDRYEGWDGGHLDGRGGYLEVEPAEGVTELTALVTDSRSTRSANPLSPTLHGEDRVVELVYDSLATERDGELAPWLASNWEWADDADEAGTELQTATVDIRENCRFHDGEPLTAADVAFTYRFLADTLLGRRRVPVPAPRYRGRVSAIDSVEVVDEYRLEISTTAARSVAERAFVVPVLPEHRWSALVEEQVGPPDATAPVDGWSPADIDNLPPVGSGPYRYDDHSERDFIALTRNDEHFSLRPAVDGPAPSVETIRFEVDPGSVTSADRVRGGSADVTASHLSPGAIGDVADDPDLERFESSPRRFYHLGFNVRSSPCSNTHFRRAVTSLLDKAWIAETVFEGHATPAVTPLADEWVPDELAWDGADPVTPFPGADGELDVDAARTLFEEADYRYDDEGRLLEGY